MNRSAWLGSLAAVAVATISTSGVPAVGHAAAPALIESPPAAGAAPATAGEDWPTYHGDPAATHYSRLKQINTDNVTRLQVAWTYDSGDGFGEGNTGSDMESNPLIVDGRLVFVSPKGRLICLDGATGRPLWVFDPADGKPVRVRQRLRGVAYWSDRHGERILFTFRHNLLAVDLASGTLIRSFGHDGRVDLREGLGREVSSLSVTNVTPGVVYRDLLILGSTGNTPGDVRAYDVRSGAIRWSFHTIPHPGEVGYDTWPKDAWKRALGANVWAGLTLDPETGTVFLPVASAGMLQKDFYGADRHGDDLFSDCIVALDAATGRRLWHFQTIRHDLWDRDLPAQPNLVTVKRNGRSIPALAQVTKSGWLYVLDRRTGKSLFPLEERRVFPSDIPGELAAQKQIFPLAPEPFTRQHLTSELLTQRTPQAHAAVAAELAKMRSRGPYDPPSLESTISFPGLDGGAGWGGAAYDPDTGLLYINANETPWIMKLIPRPPGAAGTHGRAVYLNHCASCHGVDRRGSPPEFPSLIDVGSRLPRPDVTEQVREGGGRMPAFQGQLLPEQISAVVTYVMQGREEAAPGERAGSTADEKLSPGMVDTTFGDAYIFGGYNKFLDPDGYPAVTPPWGTLSAIDVSTGRYLWKVPFGQYPELAAQGMTETGSPNYGGAVVTAGGLLFIGATVFDNQFHAFDKKTGRLLWKAELPAAGLASPATYMAGGRQYVVICAGGGKNKHHPNGGSVVAFALP